ncbi:MAG TPA: S9 family peptidase [Rhizomicrobium sp.]|jgi:dipeptidyl aminopeptidase/acylaminoacyl peptidase|nr:S9 family peptidase [Rhizomicrobium sp.]
MRLGQICAGILLAVWSAAAQAAPLEAYGQLPSLDDFTISPDGKNLAYVTNVAGKRTVLINAIDAGKVIAGVTIDDQKLRDLTWADNDHLLITLSVTHTVVGATGWRSERYMTQSYSLATHSADVLLAHGGYQMNIVRGVPQSRMVDGHSTAFVEGYTFVDHSSVEALFAADLASGRINHIVEIGTPEHSTEWLVDQNGEIAARTEYNDELKSWTLKIKHGAGYTVAYSVSAPYETPAVIGIMPDGKSILIEAPENGRMVAKQFSLANDAAETAPDLGGDGVAPVTDPVTHRLIGTMRLNTNVEYVFFNPADQAAWNGLARAFPDENVELVSWSGDRKIVVVRVDGRRDGSGFFMVDLNTHKASFLGSTYAGIEPADAAEVKLLTYAAADGTRIPAYLTLPNGRAPKGLPLVVLPHGGPQSRDMPEFDWLSQALASRGYAVLQPQFRGSYGFGWPLYAAGFGEWGRKMQTDLSDGVRYLAAQGTIDAKRVCIVGASYGGYAALAGATLDPGVYRCAVSDSGVADTQTLLQWQRDRDRTPDIYTMRYMGVASADDAKLSEISPLHHVAQETIPILLIHGKDDTVVPIDQSEAMAAALTAAGKPVTFLKLDREDHWLSNAETRQQMLQATVAFLEANNPAN